MAGYKSPGRKISEYIGIIAIIAVFTGVFYKNFKNENQTGNGSLG